MSDRTAAPSPDVGPPAGAQPASASSAGTTTVPPGGPGPRHVPAHGLHLLHVVRTETVTPQMLRVVLGGADPAVFTDAAPGAKVKMAFPAPGAGSPGLDELAVCARRSYTVRRARAGEGDRAGDPAAGEVDVDVVLHEGGLASGWAQAARPGDTVGASGPSSGYRALPTTDVHLLLADATGLPAVAAVVEALPAGARAVAVVEVADAAEEQEVATAADVEWRWVHRGPDVAVSGQPLEAVVTGLDWPAGDGEQVQVLLAAESGAVRRLQRHLSEVRRVDPQRVHAKGYWKVGASKNAPGVRRLRPTTPLPG
ncbi:siderophore-interacting protein [uncultured Pseudokineococcus sp.]|uniref:siderophore-interacting protein n=1 Tax=uncultured Pseudokineococcus sp. TaxID=1642928 RepID=UPI00262EE10A|nr:siderophore-interacting protein [uncultured Pseudokineococcus sp.]